MYLLVGVAAVTLIEANKKRKLLAVTNHHASAIVYISDKATPGALDAKWVLYPYETIIFDGQGDDPSRAYFVISDTANTPLFIGDQNEEK